MKDNNIPANILNSFNYILLLNLKCTKMLDMHLTMKIIASLVLIY